MNLPPIERNGIVATIDGNLTILPMQPMPLIEGVPSPNNPAENLNAIKLTKVSVPDVSNLDPNDDDVSTFDLVRLFFKQNIINYITDTESGTSSEGGIMETTIGDSITQILVRLILKVGGGVLVTLGVTSSSLLPIVGGIVTILIGAVASWFNNKKLVAQPAPAQTATIAALTAKVNATAVTTAP